MSGSVKELFTEERVDNFKSVWSIGLVVFGMFVMTDATVKKQNLWPFGDVGAEVQIPFLILDILLLGCLEGIQISLVALKNHNSESFKLSHPRAYKTNHLSQQGNNLERFLMGRQVFVVITVFFGAYITTQSDEFDNFMGWHFPSGFGASLFQTGLMGVLVVAIFGQLMPQVVASAYPINFMESIPFVYPVFCGCLFFEDLGIMYLCYTVAEFFMRISGLKTDSDKKPELVKRGFSQVFGVNFKNNLKTQLSNKRGNLTMTEAGAGPLPSALCDVLDSLETTSSADDAVVMEAMSRYPELFNNFPRMVGGHVYASPQQVTTMLQEKGFRGTTPGFLLPVGSPSHVPPHIFACRLLAEQKALLDMVEDKEELYLRAAEISEGTEVEEDEYKDLSLLNAMQKID